MDGFDQVVTAPGTNNLTVLDLWETGRVRRYHTEPGGLEQNTADHAWGVAMLLTYLHPGPSAELLTAALRHDMQERWTGDLPSPTKWGHPGLHAAMETVEGEYAAMLTRNPPVLTDQERWWLKCCDILELCLFAAHQSKRGNIYALDILQRGRHWLTRSAGTPGPADWMGTIASLCLRHLNSCAVSV